MFDLTFHPADIVEQAGAAKQKSFLFAQLMKALKLVEKVQCELSHLLRVFFFIMAAIG